MCLILLGWRVREDAPLVVAANREEFHARPAGRAAFWKDKPAILGGRDLEAGGTWMGLSRSGRFAAVTNVRGGRDPAARESRGALVTRFLEGAMPAADYVAELAPRGAGYSGFNLLAGDGTELWWLSNRAGPPRRLEDGVFGLGNDFLDADEPAVREGKARLAERLGHPPGMDALMDVLAPARLTAPQYGTRCSTACVIGGDGRVAYAERAFEADGREGETVRFEFLLAA